MEGNSDNTANQTRPQGPLVPAQTPQEPLVPAQTPQEPIVFDGMLLPPFPPLMKDAKKRFEDIKNLPCRKDDVILAIYPKSGKYFKIFF